MALQVGCTNRGKPELFLHGHTYNIHKKNITTIAWRCSDRQCKSRCMTNVSMDQVMKEASEHSCGRFLSHGEWSALVSFDNMCKSNILCKPGQLVTKFQGSVSTDTKLPSVDQLRRRVVTRRNIMYPSASSSNDADNNNIMDRLYDIRTINEEVFVQHVASDKSLIVFATNANIQRLCNNTYWMSDGTFKCAPKEYMQLYTISAQIHGLWMPLIYMLMAKRTVQAYFDAWQIVICRAISLECHTPEAPQILIDFEKAAATAFRQHFPSGAIHRCNFHFTNTVMKNLRKKNCATLYNNDEEFKRKVQMLCSLAFIPPKHVNEQFNIIVEDMDSQASDFVAYFKKNFVKGAVLRTTRSGEVVCAPANYDINEWNVYHRFDADLARTTNAAEAYHRRLHSANYHGEHANVFKLVSLLLDIDQSVAHKMGLHLVAGAPPPKKKKSDAERDANLRRLYEKYCAKELSLEDYMYGCSGNVMMFNY